MSDLYELVRDIIYEEVMYLRHYIGEVVDNVDTLKKGRVKITIPELGLDNPSLALWCFPRQGMSLTVPKIGSYAEVYFINGDRTKPVYIFPASEIIDNTPLQFDGAVKTKVLFESSETGEYIKYNEEDKKLEINLTGEVVLTGASAIKLLDANESFVLGDTAKAELQKNVDALTQLKTDFSSWTPVPNDGGAALKTILSSGFGTKPIASLANILSTLIKGA